MNAEIIKTIKAETSKSFIIPVGGCGEFGMNCTLLFTEQKLYVIDCGVMFPDRFLLGVDAIIGDLNLIFAELGKPEAYFITHGHEDHIGALVFFYKRWPAPIYATQWTQLLLEERFDRFRLSEIAEFRRINAGDKIHLNNLSCDWIGVNHSIPMACALYIKTPSFSFFHSGDFKFEDQSLYDAPLQESLLKEKASRADFCIIDSTNALSSGATPSEYFCKVNLDALFSEISGDIFLTTFSSNLWRIFSVLELAEKYDRYVHLTGASMERVVEIARKSGLINAAKHHRLLDLARIQKIEKGRRVYLCTGCQGEPLSALSRLSRDEFSGIKLKSEDAVIFSSRVIPGSERQLAYLESRLAAKNISVYSPKNRPGIHVSGHAYQNDIERLVKSINPRYLCPVHGTFTQIKAHQKFLKHLGFHSEQILNAEDGVVFAIDQNAKVSVFARLEPSWLYIDAYAKSPIGIETVRQRLKIGESGILIFSGVCDFKILEWVGEVFIDFRGIGLPDHLDPERFEESLKNAGLAALERAIHDGISDATGLNEAVRIGLRQFLNPILKKKIIVSASIHAK